MRKRIRSFSAGGKGSPALGGGKLIEQSRSHDSGGQGRVLALGLLGLAKQIDHHRGWQRVVCKAGEEEDAIDILDGDGCFLLLALKPALRQRVGAVDVAQT